MLCKMWLLLGTALTVLACTPAVQSCSHGPEKDYCYRFSSSAEKWTKKVEDLEIQLDPRKS